MPGVRSFAPLLDYLSHEGVTPRRNPCRQRPLTSLIGWYRRWLVTDRALAPATVLRYETLARRFLAGRVLPGGAVRVDDLSGADVTGFLLRECARLPAGAAKGRAAELRALFRFLYLQGLTPRSLSAAVPPVARLA